MPIRQSGFINLHTNASINFLMNRMADAIPAEVLTPLGEKIDSLASCIDVFLAAASTAETAGALSQAAAFYRGAEFYITHTHAEKISAYENFMRLNDLAHPELAPLRNQVAYDGGFLPIIDIPAQGKQRDIIVAHSGFDGLMEELYPIGLSLAQSGYRVILFEGPGQGATLRRHQLTMPFDWEKPFAKILDHFEIQDCIALGLSLGGYLAPRAAAFEPRIKKLIIWGAMYDFADCFARNLGDTWQPLRAATEAGNRDKVNQVLNQARARDPQADWGISHGMFVSGAADPFEFIRWLLTMNLIDESQKISQDTLLIMGSEDHLVPFQQLYQQAAALTSARSVTTRVITAQDHGAEHCQIGNPDLVVNEISRWLDGLEFRALQ